MAGPKVTADPAFYVGDMAAEQTAMDGKIDVIDGLVDTLISQLGVLYRALPLGREAEIKTVTFDNTSGAVDLFTVTGDVKVAVVAVVKTLCASAGACNGGVGIAGATTTIIANTDITLMAAGEIWHDATPDAEIEAATVLKEFIISDGNDIILTLSAQADSGAIAFYCFWTPLSADGSVEAAA